MLDKICTHCKIVFQITDKDIEFYEKVSPSFDWRKYNISTPNLCPECRQQRRLSFRNERKLYKRKCDYSWKEIISTYSPDKKNKVYDQDIWWSDKWEALDYWIDFDFNKTFFEPFNDLIQDSPRKHINQKKENTNSIYSNIITWVKNSYLSFAGAYSENIYYTNWFGYNKNCIDSSYIVNSENCYECLDLDRCYNCKYTLNSSNCNDSIFLYNCKNCSYCLLSANLYWKKYYINNKKFTREDYKKIIDKLTQYAFLKDYIESFNLLLNKVVRKNLDNNWSDRSIWNKVINSKNVLNWFDVYNVNFARNIFDWWWWESLMDFYEFFDDCSNSYEWQEMWKSYKAICCSYCYLVNNISYCLDCYNCSNLFWCVWLRNKSYCILNKQYTKEEYNKLVPKIIEHMQKTWERWESFPSSLSPFWYNETVAEEYFPMTREEVINDTVISSEWNESRDLKKETSPLHSKWHTFLHWKVFNWSDYEAPKPKVDKIIPANKLPEDIKDIPDDILNRAIECEVTKKPFRIIPGELEFYRKHNLPIPRRHPDRRHLDRMKLRNPRKLFDRKCDKCKKDIKTTYSPERLEIVYCEECYNNEVY